MVLNTGVAGNTVRDIHQRWQTDVPDLKPDYVSIMCGVNDVIRQFNIRVHMNAVGHMLLAGAFLKAIGAPFIPGDSL